MKIWYIVANNGDGSSSVEFYDSQECIDYLTGENTPDDEAYLDGDGGSYGTFEADNFSGQVRSLSDISEDA